MCTFTMNILRSTLNTQALPDQLMSCWQQPTENTKQLMITSQIIFKETSSLRNLKIMGLLTLEKHQPWQQLNNL